MIFLYQYVSLDSDLAEIFKTDTETKKELDFKNIYDLYYWMYYLFRQILKEKMSKLSDDLKDEEILIQLAETNESIFQIIIKTGADDDMNAILAQETILKTHSGHSSLIQWGASSRTVVVSILPHAKFGQNDPREDAPTFTYVHLVCTLYNVYI